MTLERCDPVPASTMKILQYNQGVKLRKDNRKDLFKSLLN